MSAAPAILLAGGGTMGHVAPLLATAAALRRRVPDIRLLALGTAEGLEAGLVEQHGLDLAVIPRVPLPRRPSPALLRLPGRLLAAVDGALHALDALAVGSAHVAVVGFGGYVATPAYLAARRRRVPIVVHEANSRPGLANRLGARWATAVGVAFPGTPIRGAGVVGMPLRREISSLDRTGLRAEARAQLGLTPHGPVLLVTGGSLGAKRLNDTFGAAATAIAEAGVQVLHICGRGKDVDVRRGDGGPPYIVREYMDRMDLAYAAADFVVCRAGAGTVSEVTALGLPAAYVPLPVGNGEQRLNAAPVVGAGGGLLVADEDCTVPWVVEVLLPVVGDEARRAAMAAAATGFGIADGDDRLADLVLAAAGHVVTR